MPDNCDASCLYGRANDDYCTAKDTREKLVLQFIGFTTIAIARHSS